MVKTALRSRFILGRKETVQRFTLIEKTQVTLKRTQERTPLTRWGEELGAPRNVIGLSDIRAGFEPFRVRAINT
jgi:hypothetical protein